MGGWVNPCFVKNKCPHVLHAHVHTLESMAGGTTARAVVATTLSSLANADRTKVKGEILNTRLSLKWHPVNGLRIAHDAEYTYERTVYNNVSSWDWQCLSSKFHPYNMFLFLASKFGPCKGENRSSKYSCTKLHVPYRLGNKDRN